MLDVQKENEIKAKVKIIIQTCSVVIFIILFLPHHATPHVTPPPAPIAPDYTTVSGKPLQFAVFAFDGSKDVSMWKNTIDFVKEMKNAGKPLHFTYFMNSVYFIADSEKNIYEPPRAPRGSSLIGFGGTLANVEDRTKEVNEAFELGNEIGSHANGHFDGTTWTYAEWKKELDEFDTILEYHQKEGTFSTSTPSDTKLEVNKKDITGFRAPVLGINKEAMRALHDSGYRYDTSEVAPPRQWPKKNDAGLWEFPLGTIFPVGSGPTISMDYSIYSLQTGAIDLAKKDTPLWNLLYKETYDAYMKYFNDNYNGNRAPIFIGHHFSLWNDGLYWEVMKSVAREICGKPEVRCGTYSELADYLDQLPQETLTALQNNKPLQSGANTHAEVTPLIQVEHE